MQLELHIGYPPTNLSQLAVANSREKMSILLRIVALFTILKLQSRGK